MKVCDIKISDIEVTENVRTSIKGAHLVELMESIKQYGLKQAIGVAPKKNQPNKFILVFGHRRLEACRKLGHITIPCVVAESMEESEMLLLNITENIQRQDILPSELGRICDKLKKMGLNENEIASRLSIPLSRVRMSLDSFYNLPEKYRDRVMFSPKGKPKAGYISATTASKVISLKRQHGLTDRSVEKLLTDTRFNNMALAQMETVSMMIESGMTVTESLSNIKKFRTFRVDVTVDESELIKAMESVKEKSAIKYLHRAIFGEVKPINKPSFVKI